MFVNVNNSCFAVGMNILNVLHRQFQRNPSIQLYGLPWVFPGWLHQGGSTWTPYANRTKLVDYIISWLDGARDTHGLAIDYIGVRKISNPFFFKFFTGNLSSTLCFKCCWIVTKRNVNIYWELWKEVVSGYVGWAWCLLVDRLYK